MHFTEESLHLYVIGALSLEERARFEAHGLDCAECAERIEREARLELALYALAQAPVAPRRLWRVTVLAAMAASVAAFFALRPGDHASQPVTPVQPVAQTIATPATPESHTATTLEEMDDAFVLAVVDGAAIRYSDLGSYARTRAMTLTENDISPLLASLVDERLIDAELRTRRSSVTPELVQRAYDATAKMNDMNAEQFAKVLERRGNSEATFKEQLQRALEESDFLAKRAPPDESEVQREIAHRCEDRNRSASMLQVKARHIVVTLQTDASAAEVAAASARIHRLKGMLAEGWSFEDLAARESDDQETKGGDLGYFGRGEMEQAFEDAAFAARLGEVVGPVRLADGLHLLVVEDLKLGKGVLCTDPEVQRNLRAEVLQDQRRAAREAWVSELRSRASVELRWPP